MALPCFCSFRIVAVSGCAIGPPGIYREQMEVEAPSEVPDPLPLRTIPVPPEVTAVAGCNCGGLEWHREDCTIWSVPADAAMAAVDAALAREQAFSAELNAKLPTCQYRPA
jgi:hypothetical protein